MLYKSKLLDEIQKIFPVFDLSAAFESGCSSRHRELKKIQDRFNNVYDNIAVVIISPEEIDYMNMLLEVAKNYKLLKGNYDDNTIIKDYFTQKLADVGIDINDVSSLQNLDNSHFLIEMAGMTPSSPMSASFPYNVKIDKKNKKIKVPKAVSFVVLDHYSSIDSGFFLDTPGALRKLKEKNITLSDEFFFGVFHEIGHAIELENALSGFHSLHSNDTILSNTKRYKTETIADLYAVLQLSKMHGNTDFAKIIMMVRAKHLKDSYNYFKLKHDEISKIIFSDLVNSYDEEGFADDLKEQAIETKYQIDMEELGEHLSYFTPPSIDHGISYINKAIKDGSLFKMNDKELLEKAVELANESMIDKNNLIKMFNLVVRGETAGPLFDTLNKYTKKSDKYFGIKYEFTKKELKRINKAKNEFLREIGISTDENGFDEEFKEIEKLKKLKHTKLDRKANAFQNRYRTERNRYLLEDLKDKDIKKNDLGMYYAITLHNHAKQHIDKLKNQFVYYKDLKYSDLMLKQEHTDLLKNIYTDQISYTSVIVSRKLDYREKYLKEKDIDTNKSTPQLMADFVRLSADTIATCFDYATNDNQINVYMSEQDVSDKKSQALVIVNGMAEKESQMNGIAKELKTRSDFTDLKDKFSQFYNQINNMDIMSFTSMSEFIHFDVFYNDKISKTDILVLKKDIRDMVKQRGCASFIAKNLVTNENKLDFIKALNKLNGHAVIKDIKKHIFIQNKQVNEKV